MRRLMLEAVARNESSDGKWVLRRVLEDSLPMRTSHSISCDASPWGGGGILWVGARPVEYTHFVWSDHTLALLGAVRDNTCQTLFEFLTVYLCPHTFVRSARGRGVIVLGDNLG